MINKPSDEVIFATTLTLLFVVGFFVFILTVDTDEDPVKVERATTSNLAAELAGSSAATSTDNDSSSVSSSWKTYENGEYGFSFKHPNWRTDNYNEESVQLYSYAMSEIGNPAGFKEGQNKITTYITEDDFTDESMIGVQKEHPSGVVEEVEKVSVKGRAINRIKHQGFLTYEIPVDSGDKLFVMTIFGDADNFDILDSIVTTLTFAQSADLWKTYNNEEYGFSFEYPGFYEDLLKPIANDERDLYVKERVSAETYPNIIVTVDDLDGFVASSPGGVSNRYHEGSGWDQPVCTGNCEDLESPSVRKLNVEGPDVYHYRQGFIGGYENEYFIPRPSLGVMIEISFAYNTLQEDDGYTSNNIDEEAVLSSFRVDDSVSGSWKTYGNDTYKFSFRYPEKWRIKTNESAEAGETIVRITNPKRAGRADTDTPIEQFYIQKKDTDTCEFGAEVSRELVSFEDHEAYDTGWYKGLFAGLPLRSICFRSDEKPLDMTLSAYDEASKNIMDRILNSFNFAAIPDIAMSLEDIQGQYTDELLSDSAFATEVGGQNIAVREPVEFIIWDRVRTDADPLVVINLLYGRNDAAEPLGYEVIAFDIDATNTISDPKKIDVDITKGRYSQDPKKYTLIVYETPGQLFTNLHVEVCGKQVNDVQGCAEKEFTEQDAGLDAVDYGLPTFE